MNHYIIYMSIYSTLQQLCFNKKKKKFQILKKWTKGFNLIKLLEENIGGKLLDIGLGNVFFNLTPKVKVIKAKINK